LITAMPRVAIAVHDFDAAVSTFRDALGMPVVDFSTRTVPTLGAHVAMCCVKERHGGMYALVLAATDPDRATARLAEQGFVTPDALPRQATIYGARFLID
jgi:catechol 2,3-dioxygenase-like lactoylglutathione lyase family enzyme